MQGVVDVVSPLRVQTLSLDGLGSNNPSAEFNAELEPLDLALLGRVNPLALEEFSALEERHKFLTEQLEDLRRTRRDLLDIVREVDERVEQVFTAAFEDTAREFEGVFARLFPGGEGKLVLLWGDSHAGSLYPGFKALQDSGFNRTAAAQRLGLSLRQIRYRIARLAIATPGSDDADEPTPS